MLVLKHKINLPGQRPDNSSGLKWAFYIIIIDNKKSECNVAKTINTISIIEKSWKCF